MNKLLSMIFAAMFAAVSVSARSAQDKGEEADAEKKTSAGSSAKKDPKK